MILDGFALRSDFGYLQQLLISLFENLKASKVEKSCQILKCVKYPNFDTFESKQASTEKS